MRPLQDLRGRFDAESRGAKSAALAALARTPPTSPEALAQAHDEALFLVAFPDDAELHREAGTTLRVLGDAVTALPRSTRKALDDTGIAGTRTRHAFSYGAARWIAGRGERATIDWRSYRRAERLDPLLRLLLHPTEADAFESGEWTTRAWLALVAGGREEDVVRWLLSGAPRPGDPAHEVWSILYDEAELPLSWDLTGSLGSTTRNVSPTDRIAGRAAGFRPFPSNPCALIARPLPGIRRVLGDEAEAWHDASAAALAARCREVLAIFETNLDEIYLADLGEGTTLCVLGLARPLRLALEANYGFVLFSNGIPIGYGGVTPLGPQANTGLNLFAPFRQSEAGMLFAQALRAFTTMFGVRRFVVNPYQFGMENEEALASGAFWFYDRLGFRARSDASRALAARERERRAADPSYRSDADTLRDLAMGDVVLTLPGSEDAPFVEEQVLTRIGAHTARLLSGSIGAARARAMAGLESAMCDAYAGISADRLAHDEQLGLRLLAPALAAVAPTVAAWPPTKRAALWEFVRLKGALQERPAARAAAEAWDFWRELELRLIGVS